MTVSEKITKTSGSNLALSFILLPKTKRYPMSVLYAFCRELDDIVDEGSLSINQRKSMLEQWRLEIERIYNYKPPQSQLGKEFREVILTYDIPKEYVDEFLKGVEMDLTHCRYLDRTELELYCYRVASVVGLMSIKIFGCTDPQVNNYAIHLGKALQLTNILRDVGIDALKGRIYLPMQQCKEFGITEQQLFSLEYSTQYLNLARTIANWAIEHYKMAANYRVNSELKKLIAAELMGSIYWRLLKKLANCGYNVFNLSRPVKLTRFEKAFYTCNLLIRNKLGLWGKFPTSIKL